MINELSSMEKGVSNMETSQLLTLIHQGFGKLPSLAAATLLKVKKDASYEIIKKLRNLLKKTDEDNQGSDSSTDSTDFPQLKNPELDQIVQSLQDIVKNPSGIEEEIGNSEVSNLERPEPISSGSGDKKEEEEKEKETKTETETETETEKINLPEFKIRNSLSSVRLLENLKAANVDDRLGMNFLLEVPRQKIWNCLCENPEETISELRNNLDKSDGNINKLISQILDEYASVKSMPLPLDYNDNWVDKKGRKIKQPVDHSSCSCMKLVTKKTKIPS